MGSDFAVIFVLLWQGIAMPVIIFLAGFQSIPQEIIEAARMDGADDKQIFWNIEITYLLPKYFNGIYYGIKRWLNSI